MRYLLKFSIPNDTGNEALMDPKFGEKMQNLFKEMKAEAVYFTTIDGERGGYAVVNMNDASEMPAMAEPLFFWFQSHVEFYPVMKPEDLMKAGPAIEAAVKKYAHQ
jgi:hypothetical protein